MVSELRTAAHGTCCAILWPVQSSPCCSAGDRTDFAGLCTNLDASLHSERLHGMHWLSPLSHHLDRIGLWVNELDCKRSFLSILSSEAPLLVNLVVAILPPYSKICDLCVLVCKPVYEQVHASPTEKKSLTKSRNLILRLCGILKSTLLMCQVYMQHTSLWLKINGPKSELGFGLQNFLERAHNRMPQE